MRLTIIVGCHGSSLNSRIGYVYTGPLFSENYCITWLSQLYSGRTQPTLLFLLSFLHCWCQGNDNVTTFTWQVSLFWILREKGIDIIEWPTIPSHFHAMHTQFSRQSCKTVLLSSFLVRKHSERWATCQGHTTGKDVLKPGCACVVMLRPSPSWGQREGLGTQEALQQPWYGFQPGTDSTAHLDTSILLEQACTKTADLFMLLISHSLLLCFHNLFNSFPPENQSPLNYVPLRWVATN